MAQLQVRPAIPPPPHAPWAMAGPSAQHDDRPSPLEDDEPVHTFLSASSTTNTGTFASSRSGYSTAMTAATVDDDTPRAAAASCLTSKPPYAHPNLIVLELVANTASASALPATFDFAVSRRGNYIAAYSAASIWLIKTAQLPRLWARTLQVKRKPVALDVTDDGFLLAVLSRPSQVDIYEIHGAGERQVHKRRTVMLVHAATSIVVSPDARILITGNKFGIEVIAIGQNAPETARRTLSGPAGDALEFSDDGRTLLITGYARKSDGSALFVLPGLYDGPLNEEGEPLPQPPETAWTGSVLFPETARIARQATLLPDADTGTFNELFAFNAEEDSWGIYDIACQRFTQRKMFLPDHQRWTRSEFVDDAMPAVSPSADLAAVALRMRGTTNIWIYEVPDWDYTPSEKMKLQNPIQPCFCIPIPNDGAETLQEICVLRWVRLSADMQRLIAVGNSGIPASPTDVPGVPLGSKGVIIVLDFDKKKPVGLPALAPLKTEYDLDPLLPGELLPEGSIDFEREVELERTRTVAQRRAQEQHGGSRRQSRVGSTPVNRARTMANRNSVRPPSVANEEELTAEEAQAAFEAPYDNQQPRSQMSLARAATVAAVSPANRRHLRALPFRPLEYRRADGARELPHESDADNWVPPPPAYTPTAEAASSVSLSHPVAPPSTIRSPHPPGPLSNLWTVLPTPPTPHQSAPPTLPYQARVHSMSTTDLTPPQSQLSHDPQPRRPSLLHPLTYPSPLPSPSARRRSSTAQSHAQAPQTSYVTASPPTTSPFPHSNQHTAPLRHPQSQPQYNPTRRASLRAHRAHTSLVTNLPPPRLGDPALGAVRRGSAPHTSGPRGLLPRLVPPDRQPSGVAQGQEWDLRSAPPRTQPSWADNVPSGVRGGSAGANVGGEARREDGRGGRSSRFGWRNDGKKRKVGCVVM